MGKGPWITEASERIGETALCVGVVRGVGWLGSGAGLRRRVGSWAGADAPRFGPRPWDPKVGGAGRVFGQKGRKGRGEVRGGGIVDNLLSPKMEGEEGRISVSKNALFGPNQRGYEGEKYRESFIGRKQAGGGGDVENPRVHRVLVFFLFI